MTRGVRAAAAVGALLLALTGCNSGKAEGKKTLPPLSTTPTTTPTATPSSTNDPKAEVEAFVHEYFDAMNLASRNGNVVRWRAIMTDGCVCRELAKTIENSFAAGRSIRGLRWTLREVVVREVSLADAKVSLTYDVSESDDLDSHGTVLKHYPESKNAKDRLTLVKGGGGWLVADRVLIHRGTPQ